ncbi:PREDICTED: V-type proton ATPase subunit d-like [Acropora digitifera]|uniref:V-type proton ATPase subunit d-like n=1 Tax=Acropora digitifera TaxID=70779 RepID=UPI00077B2642|nr:PREDICTED: V-type proton ATPase subunit d-like [Acropora digitifera]
MSMSHYENSSCSTVPATSLSAIKVACVFVCFSYSYMIDNIILLITGTLHQRPITELVPKCHPLGSFEEMASINIASTPADLYNAVMIDTPLAPFFVECISEQDLDEMNIEIIRNTLYKAYLEGFYKFCEDLGGTTADVMCPILQVSYIL